MNWVDILTLAVIAVVILIFTLRGREEMGAALFDTIALVLAALAGHHFHKPLSQLVGISELLAYIIVFVLVAALLIFVSALIHAATHVNFHPFNAILSFVFGIVAGWAISYAMLEVIASASVLRSRTADALQNSAVATEILTFRTITGTKNFLDTVRFIQREPWER
jgi:uncharacterized membrane protein YdjX (TVP38/TMEM64 family)